MCLFLIGLLTGFAETHFANLRMGLAAHLEGVMNGTFLVVLGAIWNDVRLSGSAKAIAFWTALYGTYGVADYAEDSSIASKAFAKAYRKVAKTEPDAQSAWTYDAVTVLCMAIKRAGNTDPSAIRDAILSIRHHPGAEGEYNFDANGDGLHGYNVVRNEKGTIVYDKHIDFND